MATKQELQESYESLSGAVERACFEMDRLRESNRELLEAVRIALWIRDAIRDRKERGYSDANFGATFEEWNDLEAVIRKAKGE